MLEKYTPAEIEQKWYRLWEESGQFKPSAEGEDAYCIMIPPPNVTGTLHMGHAFQDTIMDTLIRYHRMRGDDTLWQPGTDHAGIATQMVVEKQLLQAGTSRKALGREAFTEKVWQWKETSGNQITTQMRRLGCSPDWSRERFTMDPGLSAAVLKVFVELHDEGLIYRGHRLVNWDPQLNTAVSDLEVDSVEEQGHMWHFNYPLADASGQPTGEHLTIATTRPETLLGDTAVAVHPDDPRHRHLIGGQVLLPLCGRLIPVIGDDHADPEKGTGCVKITPAHDFNDYEVGLRHDLPMLNVLNKDATINDNAPEKYRGMDRYEARKAVVEDIRALGLLAEVKPHTLQVPRGERSGTVIEPLLTEQWYVKIKPLAEPAIAAVENGDIRFVPDNWKNTYYAWMRDIQDWCISRQLWWGHRIPAWYDETGQVYVGMDEADARARNGLADELKLTQDEDVLDTWFSAALWPFATLGWPQDTRELQRYYPTNVLVTGFDIIFFWVARMIMMGLKFTGKVPFHEVYIHGLVRDSSGQKMSKSKGNVLDPIDLIDGVELDELVRKRTAGLMQPRMAEAIAEATRKEFPDGIQAHGCDALRFTFASLASTGRDINFDLGRIEGHRNFCNKIFNASRFVLMNTEGFTAESTEPAPQSLAERWILSRLQHAIEACHKHIQAYRLDLAAHSVYEFIWNEYCDWFIEMSKPLMKQADNTSVRHTLLSVLEIAMRLLHPLMPFITEEIWQALRTRLSLPQAYLMNQPYPTVQTQRVDEDVEQAFEWIRSVILAVRQIRSDMNIAPGKALPVLLAQCPAQAQDYLNANRDLIEFIGKIESIQVLSASDEEPPASAALVGGMKVLIPLAGLIDQNEEKKRIGKLIAQCENEISRSRGKLNNAQFVAKAPTALVDKEREKLATHEAELADLQQQLEKLDALG